MNAVMIMCHKNWEQVKRLVHKSVSDDTKVIIHIDSQSDITIKEKEQLQKIAYLTETSIHGELDHRSLVDIVFLMLDKAKNLENELKIHFDYYLLLSGQDYYIKSIEYINKELKKNYPTPYIDCTPYDANNWIFHKFKSIKMVTQYGRWISHTFPSRRNCLRMFFRFLQHTLNTILVQLHMTDYYKLKEKNIDLYGGSAWWILPDTAINYIIKEYIDNDDYIKILLNSYTPEETFFQILTMRSEVASLVKINPINMVTQNCKTWAYFSDVDKPFKGHPYIFTKNEYSKLITSGRWIARKFDMDVDAEIFDMLDKNASLSLY